MRSRLLASSKHGRVMLLLLAKLGRLLLDVFVQPCAFTLSQVFAARAELAGLFAERFGSRKLRALFGAARKCLRLEALRLWSHLLATVLVQKFASVSFLASCSEFARCLTYRKCKLLFGLLLWLLSLLKWLRLWLGCRIKTSE